MSPVPFPITDLYNPNVARVPSSQGFITFASTSLSGASQSLVTGSTRLRTDLNSANPAAARAGYSSHLPLLPIKLNSSFPVLDRSKGFALRVALKVNSETHGGQTSRAGFSITLIGSDLRGIELGFWTNAVFAQNGGAAGTLFSRGEQALMNTTTSRVYEVLVVGDTYLLCADDPGVVTSRRTVILSGAIRDYSAFQPSLAGVPYSPYITPDFLFLGDNTASASADVNLGAVSLLMPRLGTAAADTLVATGSADILNGLAGDDLIRGGTGPDVLIGGLGQDQLEGGAADDRLIGGPGGDRFLFTSSQPFQPSLLGVDTLVDFEPGSDRIVLSRSCFSQLRSRVDPTLLAPLDFTTVSTDQDAAVSDAAIVYNSVNGNLFYNSNAAASGFGTGGLFARLLAEDANPSVSLLSSAAFVITP